jgi:hypothetical protein
MQQHPKIGRNLPLEGFYHVMRRVRGNIAFTDAYGLLD